MAFPNLIIPGASRSGTTSLFHLLKQHPDIYAPVKKELQFFEKNLEYNKGTQYYENYFRDAQNQKIRMDISPPYFHKGILVNNDLSHLYNTEDDAATRIKRHYPNTKILITLRNPIRRLFSQYHKNFFQGQEPLKLTDALEQELAKKRTPSDSPLCWIYKNQYSIHIQHWLSLFPVDKIKIIIFEEWTKQSTVVDEEVMQFLDLPPFNFNLDVNRNSGKSYAKKRKWRYSLKGLFRPNDYPEMSKRDFDYIKSLLQEDVLMTEKIIGKDLSMWLNYEKS